ncbi:MAG: LysR family transcriptional regulator, partial [Vibrio sp.]
MKTRSDDLVIFCAVADSGGFSAAAEQLDLQVAKVSRAIRRLETQLEVSLFNRTTRQVVLTEEGERFIAQVRQGLNQIEQAEQQLQFGASHVAGRLNIDAASPFLMHQIIPHIADFMQAYPDVRIELTSNEGFV